MLLCKNCHTKIDNEPDVYGVEVLRKFKRDHEERIFSLSLATIVMTGSGAQGDRSPVVMIFDTIRVKSGCGPNWP